MKKVFKLDDICCANCAAKIEREISELDGVNQVSVSFILQNMTLDVDDEKYEEVRKKIIKIFKKTEPDCEIIGI